MFTKAQKYLAKRSVDLSRWTIGNSKNINYDVILVIPSYAEDRLLRLTLDSIKNQASIKDYSVLTLVVINNEENPKEHIYSSNLNTHKLINSYNQYIDIFTIDAYSSGKALNIKNAGVGFARKIGLDNAIQLSKEETILCCLDADTIISKDYIVTIKEYYDTRNPSSVILNFKHLNSNDPLINESIREYEEFLKHTASEMRNAGSIYSFVPLGPTITCTALTYISVGGIPPKKATEDFYFLQQLCKYDAVYYIDNIMVSPSSRISERVYLGTGYRMGTVTKGSTIEQLYFSTKAFKILKEWIKLAINSYSSSLNVLINKIETIDSDLLDFLKSQKLDLRWDAIKTSSPSQKHFEMQFHRYFDWLKTIKLLKYYS